MQQIRYFKGDNFQKTKFHLK